MDVKRFKESFSCLSNEIGIVLSPLQSVLIEHSLVILKHDNKFENIYFWGRIEGIEADYFIAFGYYDDILTNRRYFWSQNCREWFLLPGQKSKDILRASMLCSNELEGDPSEVTDVEMDPKFQLNEDGNYIETKGETMKLKEEDRLACLVHYITDESAVIPRGALYKHLDGKTLPNQAFRGISQFDSNDASNYLMFREPHDKWYKNLLKRSNYNYATDFLDTVESVTPENKSFALLTDVNYECAYLKSLHWPGMVYFHKSNTNLHGFVYFGDGRKNLDILFMI